jgi:translation initiation factor 3 subunit B
MVFHLAALDGLPKVPQEKYDKLTGVLLNRFKPHGEIKEGCFWMPQNDDGTTRGYAFIEYSKREVCTPM